MNSDKIVLKLQAKVVTPVHVGGAQERHYISNLDFVKDGDKVYFLDESKLIHHFGIERYSHSLATNALPDLLHSVQTETYAKAISSMNGDPGQEIKRHIRNQLDNRPILPGSSIKGAIRSVLLNYLIFKNNADRNRIRKVEEEMFGKISEDAMRFLQVIDTPFEQLKLYNTKIMNLQDDKDGWFGGWKQGQRMTNTKFSEKGFTTGYECLEIGQHATLSIILNLTAFRTALKNRTVKSSYALEELFTKNFATKFLEIIQKYAAFHLKAETNFVNTFQEYDSDFLVVEAYQKVQKLAQTAPILRLGAGSGFHSMTGDWQFDDHTETGYHQGGRNHGKKKYKSRKLAFEWDDTKGKEGEYVFYPMGFIELTKL